MQIEFCVSKTVLFEWGFQYYRMSIRHKLGGKKRCLATIRTWDAGVRIFL